jgi:integrase
VPVPEREWKFESSPGHHQLDAVVSKQPVIAANHGTVISEETGADFERDRILEEAATREGVDQFGHPKQLTLEENLRLTALSSGKPPKVPLKISDAYQIYRSKHLNGRPDKASETAVAQLIEFAGDIPLEMITRTKAAEWLDHLMTDRGQSNETLRRRIGAMKAIVNFVINRDLHEDVNPFAKLKPPKAAKRPGERLPFHTVHLEAIDRYLASSNVRPETRQIVALLKLTGCRPSEIAGLKAEDLSLESGLPFLFVRWTEERRLKNEESTRRVPLIGEALDAAKAAREAVGTGWLFPSLAPKTGDANDNQAMSTRLRYMIRRAGVPASSRLVPYSFRHTVAAALDQTEGVSQTVRDRVLGHGRLDKYSARELPLKTSFDALSRALPALGKVDAVLYPPELLVVQH